MISNYIAIVTTIKLQLEQQQKLFLDLSVILQYYDAQCELSLSPIGR